MIAVLQRLQFEATASETPASGLETGPAFGRSVTPPPLLRSTSSTRILGALQPAAAVDAILFRARRESSAVDRYVKCTVSSFTSFEEACMRIKAELCISATQVCQ
jgi:hypothetical protein